MTKSTLSQLLDKQSRLAAKAITLQQVGGFTKSVKVVTEITSPEAFTISVKYGNTWDIDGVCLEWVAEQKWYGEDKSLHENAEIYDQMDEALDKMLAEIEGRANDIIDTIKNYLKK